MIIVVVRLTIPKLISIAAIIIAMLRLLSRVSLILSSVSSFCASNGAGDIGFRSEETMSCMTVN